MFRILICILLAAGLRAADPIISIAVSQAGVPIAEGQSVSGVLDVVVTVVGSDHEHAALYGNMLLIPYNEPGHATELPSWSHTARLDTARFFDGENLLSVHLHPHNHVGEPYTADFRVATFKLISENSHPAPNGDRTLPTLTFTTWDWQPVRAAGDVWRLRGGASVVDDRSSSGVGRSSSTAAPVQIIAHLGESVLGRFRWDSLNPPFGDSDLVFGTALRPFQRDAAFDARVVVFFSDGAGRANYAFKTFTMPALDPADAQRLPQPMLNAKILGLGGTLRIPTNGTTPLYVEISNLFPGVYDYPQLSTWIGNRSVAITKLLPLVANLAPGVDRLVIEVQLPASEVALLEAARQGGESASAAAVWCDFTNGTSQNLPTSSHVHLNSVRTTGAPWPATAPSIQIRAPWAGSNHWTAGTITARYDAQGTLPSGWSIQSQLDGGSWQTDGDRDGQLPLAVLRGAHTLAFRLLAADASELATGNVAFTVANAVPVVVSQARTVLSGATLTLSAPGVLASASDADGDVLSAVLVQAPRHGTVTLNANGSWVYVAAAGWIGSDRFTFQANDGTALSREGEIRIQVLSPRTGGLLTGDWTMPGRTSDHQAHTNGFFGDRAPVETWSRAFPGGINTVNRMRGSVLSGSTVATSIDYYAYDQVRIAASDAGTGMSRWEFLRPAGDLSAPSTDGTTVFVQRAHQGDSEMLGIDLATGALRFSRPYADQWSADWAPTVANGRLWVQGGTYGGLYGYAADTGAQLFFASLPQFDNWTPCWVDGHLYTWLQGTLREHDPLTGVVLRMVVLNPINAANGWMDSMPVAVDGMLLLSSDDHSQLLAVDLTTFQVRWRALPNSRFTGSPAVVDGVAYVIESGGLAVLNVQTGRRLATVALAQQPTHGPVVTDDCVIVSAVGSFSGLTSIIDRTTLTTRFTIPFAGSLALGGGGLVISDGRTNTPSPTVKHYAIPTADQVPTLTAQTLVTDEDAALTVTLPVSDPDSTALSLVLTTAPSHGTVVLLGGTTVRYIPTADFHGDDSFQIQPADATGPGVAATISVTVRSMNDAPVVNAQTLVVDAGSTLAIRLTGNDIDGDALTFTILQGPLHGVVTGTGIDRIYSPVEGFVGEDSFTFGATDGTLNSMVKTVAIIVGPTHLPAPWQALVLGVPQPAGSEQYDWTTRTFTVIGGGSDIGGIADAGQCISRAVSGDVTLTARISSFSGGDVAAEAGIMLREGTAVGARHAAVVLTKANTLAFLRRTTINGTTAATNGGTPKPAKAWLRLERRGNLLRSLASADGVTWKLVSQATVTMAADLQAILVVSGHSPTATASVGFADVTLSTPVSMDPPTTVSINFQPATTTGPTTPGPWLIDDGAAFAVRAGGQSQGWDVPASAVARSATISTDIRYNTLVTATTTNRWRLGMPNGLYQVTVVAGDPSTSSSTLRMAVNGVTSVYGKQATDRRWLSAVVMVEVIDGFITLTNLPGATTCRPCFIEVVPLPLPFGGG